jgi:transcriptional regulator with XRE-family HTH domain
MRIRQELGLPLDDETLFEMRAIRERKRLEGDWWATGLRAELARPASRFASIRDLAGAVGVTPAELHGFAEMAGPVPAHLREKIVRELGVANDVLFENRAPAPSAFRWAPNLRARMAAANMTAADLAAAIDVDPGIVRNWMELDERELWKGTDGQVVKWGQVSPATQDRIAQALRCAKADLFDTARPTAEFRWVVRPTFDIAVGSFSGGCEGFAEEIDVDPDRVERWLQWQEQVPPKTQRQINRTLSLSPEDTRLFDTEKKTEQAQG